ncbi:MAG: anti-sigma factor antagonist [Leptolyngbya sp. PLA1]|nr:anti-sigma factor antagonist [Leptolyngbya sp. PLA1]
MHRILPIFTHRPNKIQLKCGPRATAYTALVPLPNNSNVSGSLIQGVAVARVHHSKITEAQVAGLRSDLEQAASQAGGRLIVDLTEVELLTSAGLGMLVQLRVSCEAGKGRLVLCGVAPVIRDVLRITRLDKVIPARDDVTAALRDFA